MGRVGNCSSRVIDCRVGSSRVILRFELWANRVENRVKKIFFRVKIEPDKQIFESKLSQNKKILTPNFWLSYDIIRTKNKIKSDCNYLVLRYHMIWKNRPLYYLEFHRIRKNIGIAKILFSSSFLCIFTEKLFLFHNFYSTMLLLKEIRPKFYKKST